MRLRPLFALCGLLLMVAALSCQRIETPTSNVCYESHVLPLVRRDCSLCHENGEYYVRLRGDRDDYDEIRRYVDVRHPDRSLFLAYARGELDHPIIWAKSSSPYRTIEAWIAEGASNKCGPAPPDGGSDVVGDTPDLSDTVTLDVADTPDLLGDASCDGTAPTCTPFCGSDGVYGADCTAEGWQCLGGVTVESCWPGGDTDVSDVTDVADSSQPCDGTAPTCTSQCGSGTTFDSTCTVLGWQCWGGVLLESCPDMDVHDASDTVDTSSPPPVSFSQDIVPHIVFDCVSCHYRGQYGIKLEGTPEDYPEVMDYVNVDSPEDSEMFYWVTGGGLHPVNWPEGSTAYNLFLDWVKQGAPNN